MLFRRPAPQVKAPRHACGDVVQVGGSPVRLKVNSRARRISLRLDVARREVVAIAPNARSLADAVAFAHGRAAWIAERLSALPETIRLHPGAVIELGGRPCRLERAALRIRPVLKPATANEPMRLIASGEGVAFTRAVVRGLQAEALSRLTNRTNVHCAALERQNPLIALQDARSRWGSCRPASPNGPAIIRYNWRLVIAPAEVLDYVAAHECAHLVEPGHGAAFWATVRRLYGDPSAARTWLRVQGAQLSAIDLERMSG